MTSRPKALLSTIPAVCVAVLFVVFAAYAAPDKPGDLLKKADKLFGEKHYKEAAQTYQALLKPKPASQAFHQASRRIITCNLRLQLFDNAIAAAQSYVRRCKGTPYEARAERLAGNLYMLIPHWGTRAGGKFHRAQWKQGIHVRSYQHDKRHAMAHLQRARELYAKYDADPKALAPLPEKERRNWHDERIECIFDLAGCASRFGIYENAYHFWYAFWGERDEFLAATAGERDFDEYHSYWQQRRKRPIGLRVGPGGKPIFPTASRSYRNDLADDQKILFLLQEARELDRTENRKYTALSHYRQAMLARSRFGMDRLNQYAGIYWWGGTYPLKEELGKFNPWEMKDSEALVLAGGRIRKVTLPGHLDVLKLLRLVESDYRKSGMADEAQYAIALYHQSRQQYLTALGEYDQLKKRYPQSKWKDGADTQIHRIKAPQVRISQTGVQLPGRPARLQLSYRNCTKVWFVARRIDLEGFLNEIRNQKIDLYKGLPGWGALGSWHYYFTHGHHPREFAWRVAAKYVGKEVARWSDPVKDDGTHRYAHATLQTALKQRGAYLVYAYHQEPPADDAKKTGSEALNLGQSRAVFALEDLAIVSKRVKEGNLYFICHAHTGAPVPNANVDIVEVWSKWDSKKRKSIYFKRTYHLKTDKEGLALLKRPGGPTGSLHVLVKSKTGRGGAAQDRLAWSGMSYWSHYYPSRIQQGLFAYCITDRPVYRPLQTVRFKVWLRQMSKGILDNRPHQNVSITVYDPRGNKAYSISKRTDDPARRRAAAGRLPDLRPRAELRRRAELPRRGVQEARVRGHRRAGQDPHQAGRQAPGRHQGPILLRRAGDRRHRPVQGLPRGVHPRLLLPRRLGLAVRAGLRMVLV